MATTLNIGLAIPGSSCILPVSEVLAVLSRLDDITVVSYGVSQSNTELTCIVRVLGDFGPNEGWLVAKCLRQECIAVRYKDGLGALYGPQAAKWGEFNPAFFISY